MEERRPGVWRLRVVTGYQLNGQPILGTRTVHGTKRQAQSALSAFVREVELGAAPMSGRMTFGSYLVDKYLPHIKATLAPGTYRVHSSKINHRIVPDLGHIRLDKLTAAQLDAAYQKWRGDGLRPSTVKAHHLIVSSALSQAVKWQLIPRSVASLATLPRTAARAVTLPTIEQIRELVAASADSDPVLSAAVMLATLTGARRGELLALRWSDVDRDRLTITIGRSITRAAGGERLVGATKTYTTRHLSIDKPTLAVLDAHRAASDARASSGGTTIAEDAFVLTWDPSGQTPANPDVLTTRFARLAGSVGCPKVRFHDLRHAVATTLLAQGHDLSVVSGRLGHSSPVVTLRVYAHALELKDRQAAGVMGGLLGLPPAEESDTDAVTKNE